MYQRRVFRSSWRWPSVVYAVAMAALYLLANRLGWFSDTRTLTQALGELILTVLSLVGLAFATIMNRVVVEGDEVVVRNGVVSHRVPISDVVGVTVAVEVPGYFRRRYSARLERARLVTRDGHVRMMAIPKEPHVAAQALAEYIGVPFEVDDPAFFLRSRTRGYDWPAEIPGVAIPHRPESKGTEVNEPELDAEWRGVAPTEDESGFWRD